MPDAPIPKKSLGQHWLHDEASLWAMLDHAGVTGEDTVLEIGPGLGTLTKLLVAEAERVVAVEFDEALAAGLAKRVPADNLQVVRQDILQFDLTTLPADYKVVANIPYYLTSKLVRVLSESANSPAVAVLLVQKEVAERLAAKPGQLSILGVTSQFYWQVSLGLVVKAELFTPPPKVDSQIVVLQRRAEPLFPDVDTTQFFRLVKAGFGEKRKTLNNALSAGLHLEKPAVKQWLETAGVSPQLRAQNLSLDEWHTLYRTLP
ncbi:MAG TPA: 16S rRNA (adenine(1518)-N(6)/adenine(1519)-N(6))-dimethyltransferase RsmA [Candidatus Saccharimonadales bacterium]|nr:16S rRNA (adenine(1518)-N(6)/adenine(1519)-N(6))-dimethyltransferase RsmA [Candidatus Saccharimonadales bacterium]